MISKKIDTRKLKLARIKVYNEKGKGSYHYPEGVETPYAFLYEINGTYVNILNPLEELPVCERTTSAFCDTKTGEDIGTWMTHVSGKLEDGPFYVMNHGNCRSELFSNDEIELELLKRYVLRSSEFFYDRLDIIYSLPPRERKKYRMVAERDLESHRKFDEHLDSLNLGNQYKKEAI